MKDGGWRDGKRAVDTVTESGSKSRTRGHTAFEISARFRKQELTVIRERRRGHGGRDGEGAEGGEKG